MSENRKLTKQEVAAMWLWSDHYAETGMGAIAYYEGLSDYKKRLIDEMLDKIKEAP